MPGTTVLDSGVVIGLCGSAMYDVQLSGNQVIHRHKDQLRSRVSSSDSDSTVEDLTSGGTTTLMAEPERDGANPDCSETPPPPSPPRGMMNSPADAPVEISSRADEPPVEQGNGSTEPSVRRSSRERHPLYVLNNRVLLFVNLVVSPILCMPVL